MKFHKRAACLSLFLVFVFMAGHVLPSKAESPGYPPAVSATVPPVPEPGRALGAASVSRAWQLSAETPARLPVDGLRSPTPSSLMLGLLVACLASLACLAWNTVLQLRLRRWQRTEADLSDRLALKQALVDGIPYPVSIRTLDGRLLACNRNYLDSLRMTREQARGTLLTDSDWVEGGKARLMHRQCLAVARGGTASFTDMTVRIGGQLLEIHHWVTPYRDRQGRVLGLMNGWIDITERERLARQLREAMRQADEANRAKSVFLATMSHEIRTPMNAVIGILELVLQRLAPGQPERASLEVAYEAAGSLQLLIGDILDVAKIESGHLILTPERVRLREVVESVRRMFEGLARQKGLRLGVELGDTPGCDVLIDPLRFKQVLSNLVSNAIKFTEQGQVTIRLQEKNLDEGRAVVRLAVEDTGIGIAPADQARLFQPFIQVAKGRTVQGGTGLGLAICRKLVDLMGGDIEMHSEPGKGTLVSLDLLLRRCGAKTPEPGHESLILSSEPPRRLHVLIADDYPPNRVLLRQQLEFLGHRVEEAEDGQVALELWSDDHFDVLITDCNMPRLNGYQLARDVREQERRERRAPILILGYTADAEPDEVQRCREAGMDDCLFKPLGLETLRNYLAASFAQVAAPAQGLYDASTLHALGGGRAERVRELLETLLDSNRHDLQLLAALLDGADRAGLADHAHRIKGAARMIEARVLLEACVALEQACRQGEGDERLRGLAEKLRLALEALQEELQEQLAASVV
ncbi:ATP-binding protein [Pseudomonas paraeruginosa]|uniref:ATP-binding protein n=1 Tax=Pseudomonas paraeruginosa TaxID=2994495 RepID=UPI0039FD1633